MFVYCMGNSGLHSVPHPDGHGSLAVTAGLGPLSRRHR